MRAGRPSVPCDRLGAGREQPAQDAAGAAGAGRAGVLVRSVLPLAPLAGRVGVSSAARDGRAAARLAPSVRAWRFCRSWRLRAWRRRLAASLSAGTATHSGVTMVGRKHDGREPSEPLRPDPHRAGPGRVRHLVGVAVLAGVLAGCGGGPDASVGVVAVDGTVQVRAKACGDGGIERIDVVDPAAPDAPVWSAVAVGPASARRVVPVAATVPGYEVDDGRRDGALPDRRLQVLVEGPDGACWGGPRFTPSDLDEGVLRVAGQDVPLGEWEAEPARCPDVGVAAALVGGAATAVVAGLLWLVVRVLARLVRRS